MSDFHAKVCLNGHPLVTTAPLNSEEYCEKCGSKMISIREFVIDFGCELAKKSIGL